jgi:predicted nucleic acid-binding protein
MRRLLRVAVSQPVLLEAERNIQAKMGEEALRTYHRLLAITPLILVPIPSSRELQTYKQMVDEKDIHVIAATIASGAQFLVTLDRVLATQVNQAKIPIQAVEPGQFIKEFLPDHPDYPSED